MPPILVTADIDENHRVTLKLPDDMPTGKVILRIEIIRDADDFEPNSREWVQAKLKAAGLLVENPLSDEELAELEGFDELSDEEEDELGLLLSDPEHSTLDLINEDREERF